MTAAYQAAAQAIGLKSRLIKPISARNYIDFLISLQARADIDTCPAADYADLAALLGAFMPDGSGNSDNFNSPQITTVLEQARGSANPDQRAAPHRQPGAVRAEDRLPAARPAHTRPLAVDLPP